MIVEDYGDHFKIEGDGLELELSRNYLQSTRRPGMALGAPYCRGLLDTALRVECAEGYVLATIASDFLFTSFLDGGSRNLEFRKLYDESVLLANRLRNDADFERSMKVLCVQHELGRSLKVDTKMSFTTELMSKHSKGLVEDMADASATVVVAGFKPSQSLHGKPLVRAVSSLYEDENLHQFPSAHWLILKDGVRLGTSVSREIDRPLTEQELETVAVLHLQAATGEPYSNIDEAIKAMRSL